MKALIGCASVLIALAVPPVQTRNASDLQSRNNTAWFL